MLVFSWDIICKGTFDGIFLNYVINEIDIIELQISKFNECKFGKKPL
jgi:hypothetical protein